MQTFLITGVVVIIALLLFIIQKNNLFMANVDQTLDAIIAQFNKAKGEIVGKITELSNEIANGGGSLSPVTQAKLDTLVNMAQAFDDIVPDAPVATPPDQNLPPVETLPVTPDPVTTPPADATPPV